MIENKNLLLGICGSPRNQATEFSVKYALNYATEKFGFETEFWTVRDKKIGFCTHCDYCIREKKGCVQKDDLQELYPKLENAKYFLFGTPVFQGNLSAQLKAVIDRCRALVTKKPEIFWNKNGIVLAVGGDRNGGQEPAIRTILDFYIQNGIITVSGGAFGANLGACLWSEDLGKKGVEKDKEGLRAIKKVVNKIAKLKEKN